MKIMVIDVGSNTVKYDIFSVTGDTFSRCGRDSRALRLILQIKDRVLSEQGLEDLILTLNDYLDEAKNAECEKIECFATASLRALRDPEPTLRQIQERTGLRVRILSGAEEAACSLRGMLSTLTELPERGLMIDMGGGSTELNVFENGASARMTSCCFGAASLYRLTGERRGLNGDKEALLRAHVRTRLPEDTENYRCRIAVPVGGTARAAAKLCSALLGTDAQRVTARDFSALLDLIRDPDDLLYERMSLLCPDRSALMACGCAAFDEIFSVTGVQTVLFCQGGVREGYLSMICDKRLTERGK